MIGIAGGIEDRQVVPLCLPMADIVHARQESLPRACERGSADRRAAGHFQTPIAVTIADALCDSLGRIAASRSSELKCTVAHPSIDNGTGTEAPARVVNRKHIGRCRPFGVVDQPDESLRSGLPPGGNSGITRSRNDGMLDRLVKFPVGLFRRLIARTGGSAMTP